MSLAFPSSAVLTPYAHSGTLADVSSGYAVCVSGPYIVVPECDMNTVAVYDSTSLELVRRLGGHGQFDFGGFYGGVCAGTGFYDGRPTALITDGYHDRVSEHTLPDGERVRVLGVGHVEGPRGVDANCKHVAVTQFPGTAYCQVRALIFAADAVNDQPPLLTLLAGQYLEYPRGTRLSRDGRSLFIVDGRRRCVVRVDFAAHTSTTTTVVASRLRNPYDVLEGEDGSVMITDSLLHSVVHVRAGRARRYGSFDGHPPSVDVCSFRSPVGLAHASSTGIVVRDYVGRVQVFNTVTFALPLPLQAHAFLR